jgi:hypothetical protein
MSHMPRSDKQTITYPRRLPKVRSSEQLTASGLPLDLHLAGLEEAAKACRPPCSIARASVSCSDESSIQRRTALRVMSHFLPTFRLCNPAS